LLLAQGDFDQTPEPGWVVVVSQVRQEYNSTMKFRVLLEYDPQAGRWSAVFPDLPGCASAGDTKEDAVTNAKEALALWFDSTPVDIPKNGKLLEVALP
jgi:predicted RNase H-like HicB family nuclease